MTAKKPNSENIVGKVLEKLADVLNDYNEVVDTISQQKAFQTINYDDLTDKLARSIKGVHSIEAAIHKMTSKKIEVPDLLPLVTALKNAAENYELILIGLKNKAQNTGKYGFFAYRKDLRSFEEKRRILAIRQREFSKNISSSKQSDKEKTSDSKNISVQTVADSFADVFLENIDDHREALIEVIVKNGKLKTTEDTAKAVLFYSFLTYWTLPLFNLFDKKLASTILHRSCQQIAEAYETDSAELEKMILDLREYYNSTIVENMQMMQLSNWLLKNLVEEPGMLLDLQVSALMDDSLVFDWKKLSKEYTIK